ncbi:MAG: N,N'-diacetylchitobiose phosphorylase [candidate division KSB1 bacterium]|nr:N,N'-diacetylchitobiose phosphorylase [candidate division KSB1 bacterium]MDZ7295567.1 N,N'-diacetylchitobiose phosphorylase [candidate division KSB1 bacterium]
MRYGYFDNAHKEYVIERPDVPVSWTNYLGVRDLCTVISHNAGGYSFYKSTEHHRITRFRPNGVPLDRPGYYVYIRDDETGEYWTISWQPVGKDLRNAKYCSRHGLSYSEFLCEYQDIMAQQLMFIPIADDVLLWDVRVKNISPRARKLSIFTYLEFSFHHVEIDNQNFQMSLYASGTSYKDGIIEYDFFYEPWMFHFFASNFEPDSYDCVRDVFIGPYRTETNPMGVERGELQNSAELGGNHCASLHKRLSLKAGEDTRLVFMLGVGSRNDAGYAAKAKYSDLENVDGAFQELREYWNRKTALFQCQTAHPGLDTMTNIWTLYQAETCVVWSRFASFVEVGGRTGLGFRDTSQDIMGVVHTNPTKTKERMVQLFKGHTSVGYGLHLFDPAVFEPEENRLPGVRLPTVVPRPKPQDIVHGLEDACSDDALWLVASTCEWLAETGEYGFLDTVIPYADGGEGTVYEHLTKILDFSARFVGEHGICQGLRADWNDCLNLGGGESAMVSFMHHWALRTFVALARHLRRDEDVNKYSALAEKVRRTCEEVLWDGEWYIRGFTKKGLKIGSQQCDEGKLFLNAQTWAVYSGVASAERARQCMDAVDRYLYSPYGLHLLWPAYSKPNDDIGYITRVYKGIKENGAIFSHTNPWAVIAECTLGRGDRAMKFYDAILPYNQNDIIEIRQAEPYSYCQFIIGRDHPAHGRARHPWLTGTASWFYTAVAKYILGIRPTHEGLEIDPCIPSRWQGFTVVRKWRGAEYRIRVANPQGVQKGVKTVLLNGAPVCSPIPIQKPGTVNTVDVEMG